MAFQYAVMHYKLPNDPHRGPYDTEQEAVDWVKEAEKDGFLPHVFYVVGRVVGDWLPLE